MRKLLVILLIFFNSPCLGKFKAVSSDQIFNGIPLIQFAWTEIEGVETSLIPVSYAVAEKSFFDIFVVQLFSSDINLINKEDPLNLNEGEVIAVYMTFLMPLSEKAIHSEIKTTLINNNVNINREEVRACLDAISVPVKNGDSFIVTGKKLADNLELIEVKLPHSSFFKTAENGLIRDVFSLWLGDLSKQRYMQKMKNQLLQNNIQFDFF